MRHTERGLRRGQVIQQPGPQILSRHGTSIGCGGKPPAVVEQRAAQSCTGATALAPGRSRLLEIHWAAILLRVLRSPQRSEIRDLVRQIFSTDFQYDDEYLVYTFPEDRSSDQDPSVWIDDVVASLCGIVIVARTKSRIQNLGRLEEYANSQEARYRHRQTALRRLFDAHSTPSNVQVPFSRLLPDEAISKRAWEDQLFAVRTLLRHVRQGDRLASHTFVLRHYEDILRQQSSLRDRLPDPTGTSVADDDWVQDFIGAVYDVMRADTRTARRKPIRSKARVPEKNFRRV